MHQEIIGELLRPVRLSAQQFQRTAPHRQRAAHRFAFHKVYANRHHVEHARPVAGPRDNLRIRKMRFHIFRHVFGFCCVINRNDNHLSRRGPRHAQQVHIARISIKHAVAKLADKLNVIPVMVDQRRLNVLGVQQARCHLPDPAKP